MTVPSVSSMLASELIITPEQARDYTHQYIDGLAEKKKSGIGIPSGLKNVDRRLSPLLPGQLRVIMGRPSSGKTALMVHFTRVASDLYSSGGNEKYGPPVFVSAEMAVEEIALREVSHWIPIDSALLARGEYEEIEKAHKAIDEMYSCRPVVHIGHSLTSNRRRPRLSVENIQLCMDHIVDTNGKPPILLSVDYAQRLKLDKVTRDRRLEVSEIVESIKDIALSYAVPVNLGSQVGRQVDEKKPPVPDMADAKETANLEETADSILSVMRPSRYYAEGEKIPGSTLQCAKEMFFINVLKQRQNDAGFGMWVWFDMSITRIADLEIETIDLSY